jgi:regulation of enolase protein 1 (concanavalin A-like superfamily)
MAAIPKCSHHLQERDGKMAAPERVVMHWTSLIVRTAILCVLAAAGGTGQAGADEGVTVTILGWGEVTDPAGDCRVTEHKGKVTIVVPGTPHNLNPTPKYNNVLAPRVLQEVEGDFSAQVKVNAFPRPKAGTSSTSQKISYVGAGILVWHDARNFIRCLRGARGEGDSVFVHSEAFRDGEYTPFGKAVRYTGIEDKSIYVRLVRRGTVFTVSRSLDGERWEELQSYTSETLPQKLRVGIAAINSTRKEFSPQFESLEIGR